MNVLSIGCLLLFLFSICESKSIDRALLDALGDADFVSWHDFKVPGIDGDVSMVRTELDMVLPADETRTETFPRMKTRNNIWNMLTNERFKRNAVRDTSKLWPRIIPYEIDQRLETWQALHILAAIQQWTENTCLEFEPRTSRDQSYIVFIYNPDPESGCWSYVGNHLKSHGIHRHIINLGPGCFQTNIIIHEVGHAIGLYHEHNRPDRDEYVTIKWENVPENAYLQFAKYPAEMVNSHSTPYDYYSIMHYSKNAFGKGSITIVPNDRDYLDDIGKGNTLSFYDAKIVNSMYSCAKACALRHCPDDGFLGNDCQCYCPSRDPSSAPVMRCQPVDGITDIYTITLFFTRPTHTSADIVIQGQYGSLSKLVFNKLGETKARGRHEETFGPMPDIGQLHSADIKLSDENLGFLRYIKIEKHNSGDVYFGSPVSRTFMADYQDYTNNDDTEILLYRENKEECNGSKFTPGRGGYRRFQHGELTWGLKTAEECKSRCLRWSYCRAVFYVKEKRKQYFTEPSRCYLGMAGHARAFVFTEKHAQGEIFLRKC